MNSQPDELIEEALRTYPLADVPVDFSARVMRQVHATPAAARISVANPAPGVRFRLTWMDYALGFFVTLLPPLGFGVWTFLPHQVVLQLQFQWQLLQSGSIQPLFAIPLGAAAVLLLLAFLFSLNLALRPRAVAR